MLNYALDAEYFIKELAKVDPKLIRKYNFARFLEYSDLEGYKQSALNIFYSYVDRRRSMLGTLGIPAAEIAHEMAEIGDKGLIFDPVAEVTASA